MQYYYIAREKTLSVDPTRYTPVLLLHIPYTLKSMLVMHTQDRTFVYYYPIVNIYLPVFDIIIIVVIRGVYVNFMRNGKFQKSTIKSHRKERSCQWEHRNLLFELILPALAMHIAQSIIRWRIERQSKISIV